ncbi:MAG: hypothetical protein ABIK73_07615 [candidate division WOR-3 bacterium]
MKIALIEVENEMCLDVFSFEGIEQANTFIANWVENAVSGRTSLKSSSFWSRYLDNKPHRLITFLYEECAYVELKDNKVFTYKPITNEAADEVAKILQKQNATIVADDKGFYATIRNLKIYVLF